MALTQQQKTDAYQFFIIAFGAAPGTEYLSQLDEAYSAGMTTKQIVNVYTTKPQFLALYPEALTTAEFANNLVENVVGANASEAAKAEAKSDVIGALNAGWSKGDVVYQIFSNLASKPVTDTAWGQTSAMFANKVAVAAYVTETLKVSTTDLATLQAYVAPVTSAPESVTAAEAFAITADASSVNEGGMVIFNIANGVANTQYAVKLDGVQAADITGDLIRVVTTDAAGKASLEVAVAADRTTEGAETLTASVLTQTATASVTINDTSVNTAPTVTADQTFTIVEGSAAAAAVGTVVATDVEGDAISYAITSGNDAGLFAINAATGAITLTAAGAAALDREGAVNSYSLGITATDAKSNVGTQTPVTITVGDASDVAPVAVAATAAANEAGAVVTGNLTATDVDTVDAGKLTYELKAAVEGLTINTDGSYTFDPKLNTVAKGLTYDQVDGVNIPATFIVTDSGGNKGEGTLTINVKPVPLSFKIEANKASAEEGATTTYTVTASEALKSDKVVTFTLVPGNGVAANTGTTTTNTADFATGAFNPTPVTIKAGETTATFNVVAVNDANTELQEDYSVKAEITGFDTLTLGGKVVDATGAGGVGQTFTLTSGIDTIPGLIGSANSTGTDGNDTIVATDKTLGALDSINAGLGTNTLRFDDTTGAVTFAATTVIQNVQTINVRSAADVGATGAGKAFSTANLTGVETLNITLGAKVYAEAAKTTDINVSGAVDLIEVNGGKNIVVNDATADKAITLGATTKGAVGTISLTDTKVGTGAIAINGGTAVTVNLTGSAATGDLKIGQGAADADKPTGAVKVTSVTAADVNADTTQHAVTITGGSTVEVTQTATSTKAGSNAEAWTAPTITQGAVTVKGANGTTSVTVNQTKSTLAVNAVKAVAAVTESASVKFGALKEGQSIIINDTNGDTTVDAGELRFTAAKDLTAEEVAQAFANLTNPDNQAGGKVVNGTYVTNGNFTAWTSGAASGDTVVFSSTATGPQTDFAAKLFPKAAEAVTQPAITKTDGVAAVVAKTGVLGVKTGNVTIDDNATAASAAITTVTLDGYGTTAIGGTKTLSKLTTLSLSNSGSSATAGNQDAAVTVNAAGVATLALNLNNVQGAVNLDGAADNALKTLNVTTSGANSTFGLTAAAVETLTVAGDKAASFTNDLAKLKTVTVSGSAGLTLAAAAADTITSINTTATTGAVTASIEGARATYTGGAGVDTVTLLTDTALTKAIDLGAGNDTLIFNAAVAGSSAALNGGDGTDTLSMSTAHADALDATAQTFYAGFERLEINNAGVSADINLANLGFTNYVTTKGSSGTLTLSNLANNGTVVITTAPTTGYTVNVKDAATNLTDVLNVSLSADAGVLTAANVETIGLTVSGANRTATLKADKATTVNVGGSGNLNLNLDLATSTAVTLVDASGMTGTKGLELIADGATAGTEVRGGSGVDTLTAFGENDVLKGNAGNDIFNLGDLTSAYGGAGADVFNFAVNSNLTKVSKVYEVGAGDVFNLKDNGTVGSGAAVTKFYAAGAQYNPDTTTDVAGKVNAALVQTGVGEASWFNHGGNTYIVIDADSDTDIDGVGGPDTDTDPAAGAVDSYIAGQDIVIQIMGEFNLGTGAAFNTVTGTLEIL